MATHETAYVTEGRNWSTAADGWPDGRPRSQPGPRRALLIQDDRIGAETFASALRSLHLDSSWAPCGIEGLAAARIQRFDLFFIDLDLPDMSGAAVIDALRADNEHTRFILVSGAVTASVTREALHLGALGVLGKPLDAGDVIVAVRAGLRTHSAAREGSRAMPGQPAGARGHTPEGPRTMPRSIAERWAVLMLNTIQAESDPKTITSWAKSLGVSRSVLCECCRLVHVSPHNARDFARVLRAICRSGRKWQPEMLLDLADARTLKKLLARAGLRDPITHPPTSLEFIGTQQWISDNNPGLMALRALLF